jgi:hypothetical protein
MDLSFSHLAFVIGSPKLTSVQNLITSSSCFKKFSSIKLHKITTPSLLAEIAQGKFELG